MQFRSSSNKNIEKEFKNLRKELLDLTLRNPLLNFKSRNKTLNIINQSPSNVYKTLVLDNNRMHFAPNKKEDESKKSRAHAFINQTKDLFSSIEHDKSLKADLTPSELQKRLFYIDQQAKTMVQEQGYNILYIACGFVEWEDKKKPNQKNLAPLILIPVEIERKKAGNSFSLSWTGEDLQHNISLEAKLKDEGMKIPKFKPVSYIEGVDHYLMNVKKAIRKYRDWDVVDNVALGFFSFTKFVMYNDLNPESWKDDVDLTKNELIEAIFNPSKNIYDDTFTEEEVDEKLHYKTMYQVLDADSSQIAVIENVKAGHNLVVEGPPGTGKSQTIVNLIAELIAEGKTVLFVSEKMAALEVVKSRLDSVGLGKFVLELHSHKTRRKKILKELQRATNVRATKDLKLDQTLRKLENLKIQLDDYAEVIHKPLYNVGLSAFELYGMKESSEDYFSKQGKILPLVRMDNTENITLKDLDDIIISLENLSELYSTISSNNPWNYCNPKSLLPADLREIEFLIRDTLDSLNEFRFEIESVNEFYGIKSPNTLKEYENSIEALKLLNTDNTKFLDSSILLNREWYESPNKAFDLINLLQKYQKTANLFNKFTDNILVLDIDNMIINLKKEANKKFRLFNSNPYKEELSYIYKGEVPDNDQVIKDLTAVRQNIKIRQAISDNERLATRYFGQLWSKNANIDEIVELAKWMEKFTYLMRNGTFSQTTVNLLSKDLFVINTREDMASYIEEGNNFYKSLRKLESKLNPRSKLIFKKETEDVSFESWEKQLNKWKGQLSSLHLWSQYSNTKKSCMNTPAELFVRTIEKRNIKKDEVKSLVLGNFADSLLNRVFAEEPTLATFIGELHENRIEEFKDLDRKIINLNRKRIFNKLNSQIPQIYGEANNPEAKVLAGEFTRKSGHLPLRNLLEKAGGTIKKIKPVFMMSPLSIAQYLDPTNPKLQFDVVIFDEASQVKPEDALGAFMRGKTAVVMGDTQQLPPTSFFDQMTDSESGEEVATALDMESILHLCKLSFPVKMLKWHYRSRHESLINISNREFYDNELLVYPSPSHNDPELGLKFKYNPNTSYHRGEGSANPKEAKDVVKEIFKHFNKYGDTKSLGVGTFSVAQKNAILEELEIERKLHPEFEPLFSDKKAERFFVKNLETIQGDERDVILISVGYGYDTEGKMSLNFGPLNQDGGERRLNVLVTRAREKCVVFSNFRAHDIHLTANPPFGVKSLKSFLEYAENIQLNNQVIEEYDESPFEDAIYNFLVDNGYNVAKKIGCAGFRVDLAIIDEENPGKYFLGIECDGEIYSSSKVARDRDRLRDQVLDGLGWNIYHLWSTDWYRNRELAKEKLIQHIELTKYNTKVNEIKSEIKAFESMKINPVTTFIIKKEGSDDDLESSDEITDSVDNIDNNLEGSEEVADSVDNIDNNLEGSEEVADSVDDINDLEESNNSRDNENNNENNDDEDNLDNSTDSVVFNIDNSKDSSSSNDLIISNGFDGPIKSENSDSQELNIEDLVTSDDFDDFNNYLDSFEQNKLDSEDLDVTEDSSINNTDFDNLNISENSTAKSDKNNDINSLNTSKNINISDLSFDEEYIENEEYSNSEYISDEISALKTSDFNKNYNMDNTAENGFNLNNESLELKEKDMEFNGGDKIKIRNDDKHNKFKSIKLQGYKDSINQFSNSLNHKRNPINSDIKDNNSTNIKFKDSKLGNSSELNNSSKGNNLKSNYGFKPKFKSSFDESLLKEEYLKDIPEIDSFENEIRREYDIGYDIDEVLDYNNHSIDNFENNGMDVDKTNISKETNNSQFDEFEEYSDDDFMDEEKFLSSLNNSETDESNEFDDEYNTQFNSVDEYSDDFIDSENEYDDGPIVADDGKDGIIYYDSVTGMNNPLKKNSIVYPNKNRSKNRSVAGSISNIRNEINYINKACKIIEKPEESTDVYVIDRVNDNQYYDYDDSNNYDVITPNHNTEIDSTYNSNESVNNESNSDTAINNNASNQFTDSNDLNSDINNYTYVSEDKFINNSYETSEEEFSEEELINYDNLSESDPGYIEPIQQFENLEYDVQDYDYENYDNYEYYDDSINSINSITPITHVDSFNNSNTSNRFINNSNSLNNSNESINSSEINNSDFNNENLSNEDLKLEKIIDDADKEYRETEIARYNESNVLKSEDTTRSAPKGSIEDYIVDYEEITKLPISSVNDVYGKPEKLFNTINDIVTVESPIHINDLITRIRKSCDLARAGSKFKQTINKAISQNEKAGNIIKIDEFLFANGTEVKIRNRDKPNIDFISNIEIEAAIYLVLSFNKSMRIEELSKQVSRCFGFRSTSKKTSNKIYQVLDSMIGSGKLLNINNRIEFNDV